MSFLTSTLYDSTTTYNIGDVVFDSYNIYYESLVSGNIGHSPATSPVYWKSIKTTLEKTFPEKYLRSYLRGNERYVDLYSSMGKMFDLLKDKIDTVSNIVDVTKVDRDFTALMAERYGLIIQQYIEDEDVILKQQLEAVNWMKLIGTASGIKQAIRINGYRVNLYNLFTGDYSNFIRVLNEEVNSTILTYRMDEGHTLDESPLLTLGTDYWLSPHFDIDIVLDLIQHKANLLKAVVSDWAIGTTFSKGNIVKYNGLLYRSIVDLNLGNTPIEYWNSSTNYDSGDVVLFGGEIIYGSLLSSNYNKQPDTNPTWWELTGDPVYWEITTISPDDVFNPYYVEDEITTAIQEYVTKQFIDTNHYSYVIPTWSNVVFYDSGDFVYHSGATYVAIARSQDESPPNVAFWRVVTVVPEIVIKYDFSLPIVDINTTDRQFMVSEDQTPDLSIGDRIVIEGTISGNGGSYTVEDIDYSTDLNQTIITVSTTISSPVIEGNIVKYLIKDDGINPTGKGHFCVNYTQGAGSTALGFTRVLFHSDDFTKNVSLKYETYPLYFIGSIYANIQGFINKEIKPIQSYPHYFINLDLQTNEEQDLYVDEAKRRQIRLTTYYKKMKDDFADFMTMIATIHHIQLGIGNKFPDILSPALGSTVESGLGSSHDIILNADNINYADTSAIGIVGTTQVQGAYVVGGNATNTDQSTGHVGSLWGVHSTVDTYDQSADLFKKIVVGINTSIVSNKLIDTNADFVTDGVQIGDIVYNTTDNTNAAVTAVDSATQLALASNIFTGPTKSYCILKMKVATGQTKVVTQRITPTIIGNKNNSVAVLNTGGIQTLYVLQTTTTNSSEINRYNAITGAYLGSLTLPINTFATTITIDTRLTNPIVVMGWDLSTSHGMLIYYDLTNTFVSSHSVGVGRLPQDVKVGDLTLSLTYRIIYSEIAHNQVIICDLLGTDVQVLGVYNGGSGDGDFYSPLGLCLIETPSNGNYLYIADNGNNRIQFFYDSGSTGVFVYTNKWVIPFIVSIVSKNSPSFLYLTSPLSGLITFDTLTATLEFINPLLKMTTPSSAVFLPGYNELYLSNRSITIKVDLTRNPNIIPMAQISSSGLFGYLEITRTSDEPGWELTSVDSVTMNDVLEIESEKIFTAEDIDNYRITELAVCDVSNNPIILASFPTFLKLTDFGAIFKISVGLAEI